VLWPLFHFVCFRGFGLFCFLFEIICDNPFELCCFFLHFFFYVLCLFEISIVHFKIICVIGVVGMKNERKRKKAKNIYVHGIACFEFLLLCDIGLSRFLIFFECGWGDKKLVRIVVCKVCNRFWDHLWKFIFNVWVSQQKGSFRISFWHASVEGRFITKHFFIKTGFLLDVYQNQNQNYFIDFFFTKTNFISGFVYI